MVVIKFHRKYKEIVKDPLYVNEGFENWYLNQIMADSVGAAGMEIIRRVVGDSKVMEVTNIENIEKRVKVEKELIQIGIRLVKDRYRIKSGKELL